MKEEKIWTLRLNPLDVIDTVIAYVINDSSGDEEQSRALLFAITRSLLGTQVANSQYIKLYITLLFPHSLSPSLWVRLIKHLEKFLDVWLRTEGNMSDCEDDCDVEFSGNERVSEMHL